MSNDTDTTEIPTQPSGKQLGSLNNKARMSVTKKKAVKRVPQPQAGVTKSKALGDTANNKQPVTTTPDEPTPLNDDAVRDALTRNDEQQLIRFYNESLGDKNLFGEYNCEPEKIVRHIRGKHSIYASGLVYSAFGKILQQRNGAALMEASMAFVLMYAMSPRFRDQVGAKSDEFEHVINVKKQQLLKPFKNTIFWGNNKAGALTKVKMNAVSKRFDNFLAACKNGDNDLPMTEMAAGVTLVRLNDDAYEAMCQGMKPSMVMDRYNKCLARLQKHWDKQSLDMKTVNTAAREIVAQKIAEDPTYASHYEETVAGHVRPENRVDREGYYSTWSGQWDVQGNGVLPDDAPFFTLRAPQSLDDHLTNIGSALMIDIRRNSRKPGPEDTALDATLRKNHNITVTHDVLVGYIAGWDFRDTDVRINAGEGTEPDVRRASMTSMRSILAAMDADGIDKATQVKLIRTAIDTVGESLSYQSLEDVEVFKKACGDDFEHAVDEYSAEVKKGYKRPTWTSQPRLSWSDGTAMGGPEITEIEEPEEVIENEQLTVCVERVDDAVEQTKQAIEQVAEQTTKQTAGQRVREAEKALKQANFAAEEATIVAQEARMAVNKATDDEEKKRAQQAAKDAKEKVEEAKLAIKKARLIVKRVKEQVKEGTWQQHPITDPAEWSKKKIAMEEKKAPLKIKREAKKHVEQAKQAGQTQHTEKRPPMMKPAVPESKAKPHNESAALQHEKREQLAQQSEKKPVQLKDVVQDHSEQARIDYGRQQARHRAKSQHPERSQYPETKVLPQVETTLLNMKPIKVTAMKKTMNAVRNTMGHHGATVADFQAQTMEPEKKNSYSKDDGGLSL